MDLSVAQTIAFWTGQTVAQDSQLGGSLVPHWRPVSRVELEKLRETFESQLHEVRVSQFKIPLFVVLDETTYESL